METYVLRLLERLPREKFNITCLCVSESSLTSQLRNIGCSVHITPITEDPDWQSIQLGMGIIHIANIDVIHAHLPNAHTLAGILSQLTHIPALASIHSRYIGIRDLEVQKLMNTHLHVVAKTAYFYALNLGIAPAKLSFIANGVDTEIFHPTGKTDYVHSKLNVPSHHPLIGYIGRLSPEKGPEVFINVANYVLKRIPDCHFVMVGEGPMRKKLENEITNLELNANIHLLGLQSDVPAIHSSLDLVVSTSYTEGMPLAIIEAMSSGLPIVATNVGGVIDIVEVGCTGFLNHVGDLDKMADNIITLILNEPMRISMGNAARNRVIKKFNLNDSINETSQLLQSLLQAQSNEKISNLSDYSVKT